MKRYQRSHYNHRQALKATLVLVVVALPIAALNYALGTYESSVDFTFETVPNPDTFLEADEALLAAIVDDLGDRYPLYHIPLNQSARAVFHNDSAMHAGVVSYTNVSHYVHSDNHALWTGIDFCGWTYQYLVAGRENDETRQAFALDVLIRLTTGLSMLIAVPNGGLGPGFGGVLARGYAPPDGRDAWPQVFQPHFKHANGTGPYADWRYRGYTSNDEFAGYYLFLALATHYLSDIPFIHERVALIVDQLCYSMVKNNFLAIHTTGTKRT
jgi:hypothetical protein